MAALRNSLKNPKPKQRQCEESGQGCHQDRHENGGESEETEIGLMPAATSRRKASTTPTKKATSAVEFIKPQLATLVDEVPAGTAWISETKYDGYRMQAHVRANETILFSRNALDWSHKFPSIVEEINSTVQSRSVVLDGEIVVNTNRQSSFHALQSALSDKRTDLAKYMVFDILFYDGIDLRGQPLIERRQLLEALLETFPAKSNVQVSKVLRGSATASLSKVCAVGGEGIICKRKDAVYSSGRGNGWVKVKCGKRQEFVVVGFSEPKGSREGVGALLLGVYEGGKTLRYSGRVGTGFSSSELLALRKTLSKLETKVSPLAAVDDVAGDARNGFDDNPKGFDRLVTLTRDLKPTVVVVAYGQAESFAGPAAVADFKAGLTRLLDALKPTGARLVLVSPPPFEANPALPDPGPNNANLALYAGAIRDVAAARSAAFIDLFGRVRDATLPPRTDNGLHLTPAGYAATAGLLVGGPAVPAGPAVEAVRAKVVAKNRLFFYRWRPQNETYLFGFRKNEQGKNAVEVAAFDPLVTAAEAEINAELSRGSTSRPR